MIYRDPHHSHQQSASKCKKSASKIPSPHTNHPLINITFIHPSERSASNYERNRRNARVRVGEVFVNSLFTFFGKKKICLQLCTHQSTFPLSRLLRARHLYIPHHWPPITSPSLTHAQETFQNHPSTPPPNHGYVKQPFPSQPPPRFITQK